jgi:GT2 family glycosyltransferase
MPEITIIVSFYDKLHELELVLTALNYQSFRDFEVVIAEDGTLSNVKTFIDKYKTKCNFNVIHLTQVDKGFRKNKILNKAVISSNADYLVFIDGDCIPHSEFVKQHYINKNENTVLCGKRVNLSKKLSDKMNIDYIINKQYQSKHFEKLIDSLKSKNERTTFIEEGIYVDNVLLNKLVKIKKPKFIGCNFSLHKNLLLKINGFDENYTGPGIGEDSDIEYRLKLSGAKLKSVRNKAILYHTFHPHTTENPNNLEYFTEVKRRKNFVCDNGIKKIISENF